MNIETSNVKTTQKPEQKQQANNSPSNSTVKFTDELNGLKPTDAIEQKDETKENTEKEPVIQEGFSSENQNIQNVLVNSTKVLHPESKITNLKKEDLGKIQLEHNQNIQNIDSQTPESIVQEPNKTIKKVQKDKNIFAQKIEQTFTEEISKPIDLPQENKVQAPVDNAVAGLNNVVKELNKKNQQITISNETTSVLADNSNPNIDLTTKPSEENFKKPNLNMPIEAPPKSPVEITPIINNIDKNNSETSLQPVINVEDLKTEPIEKLSTTTTQEKVEKIVENILNQSDEIIAKPVKKPISVADEKEKGDELINNDINIQENKEVLPQMSTNMNFNSDGQPFSSFMEDENKDTKTQSILGNKAQDLAEEAAILSTMAENVAIAHKNNLAKKQAKKEVEEPKKTSPLAQVFDETVEPETKTITRNEGIKKVDTKTGVTIETVVKFDNVIMNEADVEVFANLVENGQVDLKNLAPEAAQKSVQVSKTLANMLAKAQETQQPVRIDFDNDISVIIRISKDGKVSAEFLPSSQIAEAYLRENLPLLRQKFDDNNIKYDDLSQRNHRENREKENNRKKGRNDE